MSKMSKEEVARYEGMMQAFRIAKERGLDGLEKDLKFRGVFGCPCKVDPKDLQQFSINIKEHSVDTFMVMTCVTLHDLFGFGRKRLEEFIERWNLKASCICEGYTDWNEQLEILREECKLYLDISFDNNTNIYIH